MVELKKITNGMANGVEAIDENFNALNGISKNNLDWTSLGNFTSIKRQGNTVTVKVVNATRSTAGDITLGTIPPEHRPVDSAMVIVPAWSSGTTNDKHVQLNGSSMVGPGGMTILSAAANTQYTFQFKYDL